MGMYAIKLQFHQSKDGGEILIRRGEKSGERKKEAGATSLQFIFPYYQTTLIHYLFYHSL
jgi:hypothetical protein